MRMIGIDFGTKRIGIALSDEGGQFALPHETISAGTGAVEHVAELVREVRANVVVVGESKDFLGKDNPVMVLARVFADALRVATSVSVVFESELFTSAQAARLPGREVSRPARRVSPGSPRNLDASAAALILQAYLDRHNTNIL